MRFTRSTLTGTLRLSTAHINALLVLTLAFPLAVRAQAGGAPTATTMARIRPPSPRPAGAVSGRSVFDGITLTPQQRTTIGASTKASHAARAAIFARLRPGMPLGESDRRELDRIAADHNAVLRSTLTPAQRATLDRNLGLRQAERALERSRQPVKGAPVINVPKGGAK